MIDQADQLRNLVKEKQDQVYEQMALMHSEIKARVITITSGKGGVGKTNLAINLAIGFRKLNKRVVIIDGDFGLANIEVLLGIIPKYNLGHVFSGEKELSEIVMNGQLGIQFISGGSGLRDLANITTRQMGYVIDSFLYLDTIADIILIDTGAGISDSVIRFIKASTETIVITTPEPTSITDAYAVIKSCRDAGNEGEPGPLFRVVVNRVEHTKEAKDAYEKISKVAERFLSVRLEYLGAIPEDSHLIKAVKRQEPVMISFPNSESARAIDKICNVLLDFSSVDSKERGGIRSIMKRFANFLEN